MGELQLGGFEKAIATGGDLKNMSDADRSAYYTNVCTSIGLNPLTAPFDFISLNGKLRLYAKKDCTDQLRKLYSISLSIAAREKVEECYVVTAVARYPDGREDSSVGAVSIKGKIGEDLANSLMKAETKAKRRVTLSICGLGVLDESETESISELANQAVAAGEAAEAKKTRGKKADAPAAAATPAAPAAPVIGPHVEKELGMPEASVTAMDAHRLIQAAMEQKIITIAEGTGLGGWRIMLARVQPGWIDQTMAPFRAAGATTSTAPGAAPVGQWSVPAPVAASPLGGMDDDLDDDLPPEQTPEQVRVAANAKLLADIKAAGKDAAKRGPLRMLIKERRDGGLITDAEYEPIKEAYKAGSA